MKTGGEGKNMEEKGENCIKKEANATYHLAYKNVDPGPRIK